MDGEILAEFGGACVAGRGEDGLAGAGLSELPGQGVFASAAANDQDAHETRLSQNGGGVGGDAGEVAVEDDWVHGEHF